MKKIYLRSSGFIVYRMLKSGAPRFLIMHSRYGHWGFPKGKVESGENDRETAARELKEETGIKNFTIHPSFAGKYSFSFAGEDGRTNKQVFLRAALTKTVKVKLSKEHIGYKWLDYENALETLTFPNTRKLLRKFYLSDYALS